MEPIPETREAIDELDPSVTSDALLDELRDRSRRAQGVVPDCIGLSLANHQLGVTFTLVATDLEIAALDGVQYLEGGPCVEAVEDDRVVTFTTEPVDESRWLLFAGAAAARGVASTLTLPILVDDRVCGSINLYGASRRAFDGHHEELADIFQAWAPGAVTNADLSFTTRQAAQGAPGLLRETARIETAIGLIAAAHGLAVAEAHEFLADAAQRAGVSLARLARIVLEGHRYADPGESH